MAQQNAQQDVHPHMWFTTANPETDTLEDIGCFACLCLSCYRHNNWTDRPSPLRYFQKGELKEELKHGVKIGNHHVVKAINLLREGYLKPDQPSPTKHELMAFNAILQHVNHYLVTAVPYPED